MAPGRPVTNAHNSASARCHPSASDSVIRFMKTTITTLCVAFCLALGTSSSALADHRHERHGRHHAGPPRHHHDGGYQRGSNWAGPAALLAIAGIAVGVAASNYYAAPPQPVYVQPQQPVYIEQQQEPVYIEAPQPVYVAPSRGYWRY